MRNANEWSISLKCLTKKQTLGKSYCLGGKLGLKYWAFFLPVSVRHGLENIINVGKNSPENKYLKSEDPRKSYLSEKFFSV
jgi:hypothetical protein